METNNELPENFDMDVHNEINHNNFVINFNHLRLTRVVDHEQASMNDILDRDAPSIQRLR